MPKGYKKIGDGLYACKNGKIWSKRTQRNIGIGSRASVNWFGQTVQTAHIIAHLFVPREPHQNIVHHFDGNSANNSANNLMWVSKEEHKAAHRALRRVLTKAMHTKRYQKMFYEFWEEELNN